MTRHPDAPRPRMPFGVVVTRPAGQSTDLIERLRDAGLEPFEFPLIEIRATASPSEMTALDAALQGIDRFALVFFVSPNAIDHAFGRAAALGIDLSTRFATTAVIAVVGPGSVRALMRHGVHPASHRIVAPAHAIAAASRASSDAVADADANANVSTDTDAAPATADADADAIRYDSETLLAALEQEAGGPAAFAGREVLIVRGDGGRELFADALRAAGAGVQALTAYHRDIPTPTDTAWRTLTEWLETRAHAWVLTSSEGIRHLERLARGRFDDGRDPHFPHSRHFAALLRAPVIVPHPRIAIAAKRTGFDTIVTSGAGDDQIVRAALACAHSASDTHGNSSE